MDSQQPSQDEVIAALARLEESQEFSARPRSLQLLKHLVESTLRGSAGVSTSELQARLGTPNSEAVRSQIHDLRKRLRSYYETQGDSKRWRIEISASKGTGYQVTFLRPAMSASKLASLRQQRGLTQSQLADMAGVTARTVQNLERGSAVSAHTARAIATALGVDLSGFDDSPFDDPDSIVEVKPEPDFEVHFDPRFQPDEIKDILTALANYYRAVGGAGLELSLEEQETTVNEPVNA